MKPGFGNKKKNKKKKSKLRKTESKAATDDVDMEDMDPEDNIDEEASDPTKALASGSTKPRHKKMELKENLRVRLASLKKSRSKLTRLPGNKNARLGLKTDMKNLIKEQALLQKK